MNLIQKIGVWLIDLVYVSRGKIRALFPAPQELLAPNSKGNLLLVQGVNNYFTFMLPLGRFLKNQGYNVYFVKSLGFNMAPVPKCAQRIKELVEQKNLDNLIIIGHSKGGIIAKHLLCYLNLGDKIKGIIALAAPFAGTGAAKYLTIKGELLPKSPLIELLMQKTEENKRIISIYSAYDNMIWQHDSCLLDKARDNLEIKISGHNRFVFSLETKKAILNSIALFQTAV